MIKSINEEDDIKKAIEVATATKTKKLEIDALVTEVRYEQVKKQQKELEAVKSFKIGLSSSDRVKELQDQNSEYIELARSGGVFLSNNKFRGSVPLFARNIILVGAQTGEGKSTITANMAYHALQQLKRPLIITNEEHPTDVLNRIVCLMRGWAYYDHTKITDEQKEEFNRMYPILLERMDIVQDNQTGVGGLTTTLEGIDQILESLKEGQKEGKIYDLLILDYIQGINMSNKAPNMEQWRVIDVVLKKMDLFKNIYPAPIIILSQLKAGDPDNTPFKERLEKCKSILNYVTCAMEVRADKKNHRTEWIFKKSRFAQAVGEVVYTGFDKGKYVPYDDSFIVKTAKYIEEKRHSELTKKEGFKMEDMLMSHIKQRIPSGQQ
jgi:hypothetical protein